MILSIQESRGIEKATSIIVGAEGVWCIVAQWFSTVYPVAALQGMEWMLGLFLLAYARINFKIAKTDNYAARSVFVLLSATFLGMMGYLVLLSLGWRVGGFVALAVGIWIMFSSYFCLRALNNGR